MMSIIIIIIDKLTGILRTTIPYIKLRIKLPHSLTSYSLTLILIKNAATVTLLTHTHTHSYLPAIYLTCNNLSKVG